MDKRRIQIYIVATALVISSIGHVSPLSTVRAAYQPPVTQQPSLQHAGAKQTPSLAQNKTPEPGSSSAVSEEARVKTVIEDAAKKYQEYWGPRYKVTVGEVNVEDQWAYAVVNRSSGDKNAKDDSITVLAQRSTDGDWSVVLPYLNEVYDQWLNAIPEKLIPAKQKDGIRTQANSSAYIGHIRSVNTPVIPLTTTLETLPTKTRSIWQPSSITLVPTVSSSLSPEVPNGAPTAIATPVSILAPYNVNSTMEFISRTELQQTNEYQTSPYSNTNFSTTGQPPEDIEENLAEDWPVTPSTKQYTETQIAQAAASRFLSLPYLGNSVSVKSGWYYNNGTEHGAVDWVLPYDTAVRAAESGVAMISSQPDDNPSDGKDVYGTFVYIKHNNGYYTLYAHLNRGADGIKTYPANDRWNNNYSEWTPVQKGQVIGYVGSTGTTFVHLHFEARTGAYGDNSSRVDAYGLYAFASSYPPNTSITPNSDYLWISNPPKYEGDSSSCTAPSLSSPVDGYSSPSSSIDFTWSGPSGCSFSGYTFRIKTVSTMDSGGDTYIDTGNSATNRQQTIDENHTSLEGHDINWYNRDLYWGVRPANCSPSCNSSWAVRRFRIEPNSQSNCTYNVNQVVLYDVPSVNNNSSCQTFGIGDYPTASYLSGIGNNAASSIKVGGNVQAYLCQNENFGGTCQTFASDNGDFNGQSIGTNTVSSLKVQSRPQTPGTPSLQSPSNGATYNEGNSITLSWSATGNEYYGEVWGGPGGTTSFGWQSGTSNVIGSQWAGYTYSWRVKARNGSGEGGWSNTWTFTVKPAAPASFNAAVASCSQVNLTWTDSSANEEGYRIYRNGSLLTTVGAGVTSYSNTGLSGNTSYSYYVKAYRGNIESDASSTRNVTTSACPPADTESPSVNWAEPVENEQTYYIQNGSTTLLVNALDNVGVSYVRFWRWDYINLQPVDIATVSQAPYSTNIYWDSLLDETNEVLATAYDAAGNSSTGYIWLYRAPPQPDLVPTYTDEYWLPIIPASEPGAHDITNLYAGLATYFDWHFMNVGTGSAENDFYVEVWIDDNRIIRYPYSDFGAGSIGGFDDWAVGDISPGYHTVRIVVDPDNTIAESNEDNNTWEGMFYWLATAPYTDLMETGENEWNATGLWHRVEPPNPYVIYWSPVHSWWYGQDSTGNYDTGAANSGDLTSRPIFVPDTGYYLRFWYAYETETQGPDWDQRWVQISVDGSDFYNVMQLTDDIGNIWQPRTAIDLMWHRSASINLSPLAGHIVQVRFHFDTLDSEMNDFRGWYIDDFDISTTPPPSCSDVYEDNNDPQHATPIAYGQTLQSANICPEGDYDYYAFSGLAGDPVVIDVDAKSIGSSLDSYLVLFDSDGGNVLTINDDDGSGTTDSKLGYVLPHDGTYYIKVKSWNHPSAGGSDQFYNIHVYTDTDDPTQASIVSPSSDSWITANTQMISVTAADNSSGIQRVEFLWHDADWNNPDWVWLGADTYGQDGWNMNLNTSALPDQTGGAIYVWAFDWVGHWIGAGAWGINLDRTAPSVEINVTGAYGGASFRDFYVYWSGADNTSWIDNYDVQYRDGSGGTWTNWIEDATDTMRTFIGQAGHTYYFRARAQDAAQNLSAYTAATSRVVQVCAASPDQYESDNTAANAKLTIALALQQHNFSSEGDVDWVKFKAYGGQQYTLETTNSGGYADTVLELYGTDGATLLGTNDDYESLGWGSHIDWTAPTTNTYYARIRHFDPYGYGCETAYTFKVYGPGHQVYLPTIVDKAK